VLSIRGALLLASDIPNVIGVLIILISGWEPPGHLQVETPGPKQALTRLEGRENIVFADIAVSVGPAISTGC